jgi:transketolase
VNAIRGKRGHNVSRAHLAEKAMFVRLETLRLARICGAGHYSSTFSAAELFAALYYAHLRLDPKDPNWPDRDRFVLSKGHAAIGLYPILADLGYYKMSELDNFTRLGSHFGDHPNMKHIPGIDFSSGSLGHGLSIAVGMALAGRAQGRSFRTYCMLGDGELAEGQIWEAAMSASHFKLQGLVAIVDRNQLCIDGQTEAVMGVEPIHERFAAFGWETQRIDGHDFDDILDALGKLQPSGTGKPQLIVADTIKGRGVKRMELSLQWHVANLAGQDYDDAEAEIRAGLQPLAKKEKKNGKAR